VSEGATRFASAVLAVAGAAIAAYLLYVRKTEGALICATGGCDAVQSSRDAELFGVPVAGLGLAGFLGLVMTAVAKGERARLAQATLALSAFLFSCYLLYVQLAVIGAICQWCVVTDALTSAIATTALLRLWIGEAQTGFKRHC
jgi:uncharacterized membrane protein